MQKQTNETIQSMQHLDSLKAVKVAMDMNKAQDKTIDMLVNLVGTMDKNMKLLATKVLELEKLGVLKRITKSSPFSILFLVSSSGNTNELIKRPFSLLCQLYINVLPSNSCCFLCSLSWSDVSKA